MPLQENTVLLVDPDPHARALLIGQLKPIGCKLLEASDGPTAMRMVMQGGVSLVVTELYLATGEDDCLIHAVRRDKTNRKTRIVAHTHRSLTADREWAMRAGADAYLIKPTRAQRLRYVVSRLTTERVSNAGATATASSPMVRRDSLDVALNDIEQGSLTGTSCIVFGRIWWDALTAMQRNTYRRRAKGAHVSLRSDSMLGNHFVEVRGRSRDNVGLSTERPESPYRR
jgi:CheY-like chemotaxis protein